MFPPPPKTAKHSLSTVLIGAREYSGNVCFVFDNEQLWAHKALLIARVPEDLLLKVMPQLLDSGNSNSNNDNRLVTITDVSKTIPYNVFLHLLHFWYTADFSVSSPPASNSSSSSSSSSASIESSSSSSSSSLKPAAADLHSETTPTVAAESTSTIRQSIEALETKLQLHLLPRTADGVTDEEQLVADLTSMRRNQLHCDLMVNIFKPNAPTKKTPQAASTPTLTKRHTTPAKITTASTRKGAKSDTITSILNTTSSSATATTESTLSALSTIPSTSTTDSTHEESSEVSSSPVMITFPVHRFILASRSAYFHSLLYGQVCETSNSTVLLPYDLFSSTTLDIILHYFYTDRLQVPELPPTTSSAMSVFQKEMNRKKYVLRELQKVFRAADNLGHFDSLCKASLHEMENICHRFKCTCSSCVVLLPSMLAFANKHRTLLHSLRSKLLTMYVEPIQALSPLWSQKPFSHLILLHLDSDLVAIDGGGFILPSSLQSLFQPSMTTSSVTSLSNTSTVGLGPNLGSVTATTPSSSSSSISPTPSPSPSQTALSPPDTGSSPTSTSNGSSLLVDLVSMTLANITKRNAIHVLHSVHLCLSKIRSADPFPTWSQPSLALIHAILHHTVAMVSLNFEYYCVDYPILLSCVDGIGGGFSVDFLDFLLKRILNNGIQDSNAAVLYQGVVRDLIGRQEVVKNVAVDGVLLEARQRCADYLTHRWIGVKAQGGFQSIEKDTLRLMAEDINVPYRTLSKPIESEFSAMFGFKPKSSNKQSSVGPDTALKNGASNTTTGNTTTATTTTTTTTTPTTTAATAAAAMYNGIADISTAAIMVNHTSPSKSRRRLSIGSLRYPRSSKNNANRLSAEVRGWMESSSTTATSPDLDDQHSLSDNDAIMTTKHSFHRHLSLQPKRRTQQITRGSSTASLTDVLLPVDIPPSTILPSTTSSPNNTDLKKGVNTSTSSATKVPSDSDNPSSPTTTGPRKSRLTFELPETPIRTKFTTKSSDGSGSHRRSSKHKYRWGLKASKDSGSESGDDDEGHTLLPVVGTKVELLRRPLPTLGRIKFIGNVQFSKGTWVGVELESRLGQNDGSVDGVRYFQTDPQRGVFVKLDGLKLISGPLKP